MAGWQEAKTYFKHGSCVETIKYPEKQRNPCPAMRKRMVFVLCYDTHCFIMTFMMFSLYVFCCPTADLCPAGCINPAPILYWN